VLLDLRIDHIIPRESMEMLTFDCAVLYSVLNPVLCGVSVLDLVEQVTNSLLDFIALLACIRRIQ